MAEEESGAEWEKWVPVADDLVRQTYYRILGAVSFHGPISETIEAIKYLMETKRGGTLEIVKSGGLFQIWSWDGVEAYPRVKMDLWVIGSKYSNNTAYLRKRWWKLYLIEAMAKTLFKQSIAREENG